MARLFWLLGMGMFVLACDPPTHVILHAPCAAAAGCAPPSAPGGPIEPDAPLSGTPGCPALEACPPGAQCGCAVQGAVGVQTCAQRCQECPPELETRVTMQDGCPVCHCLRCTRNEDCGPSERCVAAEPCEAQCTEMSVDCCHGNRCEPEISE